jgi:hypothetical protein
VSETKSIAERVAREWYQELPFVYTQDGINALAQRIQAAIEEARLDSLSRAEHVAGHSDGYLDG